MIIYQYVPPMCSRDSKVQSELGKTLNEKTTHDEIFKVLGIKFVRSRKSIMAEKILKKMVHRKKNHQALGQVSRQTKV